MTYSYYPGCTLKNKAKELDFFARESAKVLGFELCELSEWQCCGGTYQTARNEIAPKLSSVRALADSRKSNKDCFERFEDGYQVLEENGLQDALDSVNDYTFLRGNPQTPIYDKLIFISSTDFNIDHLSISDIEVKGWKGPIFKNGVYYANGEEHSLTFEYVSSTSGKKSLPDGFDFDNKNGQLSVAIGTKLKPSSPVRMTFKVYDELGEANSEYFTISMGAIYEDLTINGVKIDAKTTRDDIILPLQVSGGVKFKDVSGSLEDADYIFIAENLPYGLTLEPNGTIVGRVTGKQSAGSRPE